MPIQKDMSTYTMRNHRPDNKLASRAAVIVVAIVLAFVGLTAGAEGAQCETGEEIRGLPNFGRVTDTIYRGGQPFSAGLSALREMGVGIIVNFRDEHSEMASEKRPVESLGIKYIEIPWSGHNQPSSAKVVEFLDLIRANPRTKYSFIASGARIERES